MIYPMLLFFFLNATQYNVAIAWSPLDYTEFPYEITEATIPQPVNVSWGVAGQAFWWVNNGEKHCKITVRPEFTQAEKRQIIFHEICHCERFTHGQMTKNSSFEEETCQAWALNMTRRLN